MYRGRAEARVEGDRDEAEHDEERDDGRHLPDDVLDDRVMDRVERP